MHVLKRKHKFLAYILKKNAVTKYKHTTIKTVREKNALEPSGPPRAVSRLTNW